MNPDYWYMFDSLGNYLFVSTDNKFSNLQVVQLLAPSVTYIIMNPEGYDDPSKKVVSYDAVSNTVNFVPVNQSYSLETFNSQSTNYEQHHEIVDFANIHNVISTIQSRIENIETVTNLTTIESCLTQLQTITGRLNLLETKFNSLTGNT